jgi:hypothetical protein
MRVAVLLSGQMRTFDTVIENLYSNLINPLNADIFISTWDKRGHSHDHGTTPNVTVQERATHLITREMLTQAYKTNLIATEIENIEAYEQKMPDELKDIYKNGFVWAGLKMLGTCVQQFYKMQRVNQLKLDYENANNFKYDLVIRCRPDNIMVNPLLPRYLDKLSTSIYGINCNGTFFPNRIYDIFFYSSSENMDYMAKIYNNIVQLEKHDFDNGLDRRDSCRLLYIHAKLHNLNVVDIDYNPCFIQR